MGAFSDVNCCQFLLLCPPPSCHKSFVFLCVSPQTVLFLQPLHLSIPLKTGWSLAGIQIFIALFYFFQFKFLINLQSDSLKVYLFVIVYPNECNMPDKHREANDCEKLRLITARYAQYAEYSSKSSSTTKSYPARVAGRKYSSAHGHGPR